MKVIHCSDLHLDSKMESNLSTEKEKERRGELFETFSRMVDYADDSLHGQESQYSHKTDGETINLNLLQNINIDYLALGHIHQYKYEKLDKRGFYCYSGCLEGRGFDELGDKGFVLLNIKDKEIKHEFIPFAKRLFHQININLEAVYSEIEIENAIDMTIREKDDSFKLYDLDINMLSKDYSENIGEEIFGIDVDSFARSILITLDGKKPTMQDNINAKLNDLIDNTDDVNNFEVACKYLEDVAKKIKPLRGQSIGTKKYASVFNRLDIVKDEIKRCEENLIEHDKLRVERYNRIFDTS